MGFVSLLPIEFMLMFSVVESLHFNGELVRVLCSGVPNRCFLLMPLISHF